MLEEKMLQLNEKAQALAFHYYIREGQIPSLIADIIGITESTSAFKHALRKYSPDQPRVPAGNPDGGQWTDGGGATGAASPNPRKKDPGAVPVKRNDGSTVMNPKTGKPLLMPKGVSLSDNAKIGQAMSSLPSAFSGSIFSRDREQAITSQVGTNAPMDYQRLYDDGQFNKTYTDFGNYNYGVVAAAAGYNLNEAMIGAGYHNVFVGNSDTSGRDWTDASENTFIPIGFQDYTSGRIPSQN